MADGGVRNMRKLFEQGGSDSNESAPKGGKPEIASKPLIPKLKKDEESTKTEDGKSSFSKPGTKDQDLKPVSSTSKVNVPKKFQNGGHANEINKPETTNSSGNPLKANGGEIVEKQALKPKPMGANKPSTPLKPVTLNNKSTNKNSQTSEHSKEMNHILPKADMSKTDSLCSTSSSSSNVSSEQPSLEKGKSDFVKLLQSANNSAGPGKKIILPATDEKSTVSSTLQQRSLSSSSSGSAVTQTTSTKNAVQEPDLVENSSENYILKRKSDGLRFRKIDLDEKQFPAPTPRKPQLPQDIDLSFLHKEYMRATNTADSTPADMVDDAEIYDEGTSLTDSVKLRDSSMTSRNSNRISMIPEMTPEDEGVFDPLNGDTLEDDDIYGEAESEKLKCNLAGASQTAEQEKKKKIIEEAEAKKKEKDKLKEEKSKKKKEDEELKNMKKLKCTGNEVPVGEGMIKRDAKGNGGLNLKVKKDQKAIIIRMDQNPQNKWLVKIDNQLGYVESNNISVDPSIIKQVMGSNTRRQSVPEEDFDQPTYDDVAIEITSNGSTTYPANDDVGYDGEDNEELIYEECP